MVVYLLGCASDTALQKDPGAAPEEPPFRYEGGWPIDESCPERLANTDNFGNDAGDTPADFALLDQFGDTVHLHDFCDHVVLLIWAGFG